MSRRVKTRQEYIDEIDNGDLVMVRRWFQDRPFVDEDACYGIRNLLKSAGQSRRSSMIEVGLNYTIGFLIAWATSFFALKALGISATVADNFWITVIFTIVSIIRSYLVRRLFNHLHVKGWL